MENPDLPSDLPLNRQHTIPPHHTIRLPDRILDVFGPHAVVDEKFVMVGAVRQHGNFNLPKTIVAGSQSELVVRPVVECTCQADMICTATLDVKFNRLLTFVNVR